MPTPLNRGISRRSYRLNLSPREARTLLAALTFWREEMLPHGRRIMRFYFRSHKSRPVMPLNRRELDRLDRRLQSELRRRN